MKLRSALVILLVGCLCVATVLADWGNDDGKGDWGHGKDGDWGSDHDDDWHDSDSDTDGDWGSGHDSDSDTDSDHDTCEISCTEASVGRDRKLTVQFTESGLCEKQKVSLKLTGKAVATFYCKSKHYQYQAAGAHSWYKTATTDVYSNQNFTADEHGNICSQFCVDAPYFKTPSNCRGGYVKSICYKELKIQDQENGCYASVDDTCGDCDRY